MWSWWDTFTMRAGRVDGGSGRGIPAALSPGATGLCGAIAALQLVNLTDPDHRFHAGLFVPEGRFRARFCTRVRDVGGTDAVVQVDGRHVDFPTLVGRVTDDGIDRGVLLERDPRLVILRGPRGLDARSRAAVAEIATTGGYAFDAGDRPTRVTGAATLTCVLSPATGRRTPKSGAPAPGPGPGSTGPSGPDAAPITANHGGEEDEHEDENGGEDTTADQPSKIVSHPSTRFGRVPGFLTTMALVTTCDGSPPDGATLPQGSCPPDQAAARLAARRTSVPALTDAAAAELGAQVAAYANAGAFTAGTGEPLVDALTGERAVRRTLEALAVGFARLAGAEAVTAEHAARARGLFDAAIGRLSDSDREFPDWLD